MSRTQAPSASGPRALLARSLATVLTWLACLALVAAPVRNAYAAGSVQPSTREPVEEDGKWKLKFTIDNGSPPATAHVPMLFVFTATALFERSYTDKTGDKPVTTRLPLQNQTPINESLDVEFSDGTGKIFTKTKFDFVIRRDRGFEAGEYDLKIKRSGDGAQIGQTIKLVLKGDNQVIDRRAIVFSGEKKKKPVEKKEEAKAGDAPATPPGGDPPPDDAPAPPPVEPKQGGCCSVAGANGSPTPALIAAALGVAAIAARRRKRGQARA